MLRLVARHLRLPPGSLAKLSTVLQNFSSASHGDSHTTHTHVNIDHPPSPHDHGQKSSLERPLWKESVNISEIEKFAAMAETWWDTNGPFKPLHMMNPVRLSFIRSVLCRHFRRISSCAKPLEGLTIVDVGCGGGLLCEPLARMGARVLGVDAVEKNIKVAIAHSMKDPITASIQYRCATAEQLVQEQQQFDVVVSLEVIEHVTDPKSFVALLSALQKEGGGVVISTINRSIMGYFLAIVAAEHLLQWLPKGTHEWSKFVTPEELALLMSQAGLALEEMAGMVFNPLTKEWALSENTSVNYIAFGTNIE